MEHRAGKFQEMETQSEFAEDHFSHIFVGILCARNDNYTQRVCNKVGHAVAAGWSLTLLPEGLG